MADYDTAQDGEYLGPSPHPYLHEPILHISNLPSYVTDENLALSLVPCGPFRPKIPRGGDAPTLNGIIEFRDLNKAEKALATLQSRPIPGYANPIPLVLSPYPPTNPPTPLPPPSASSRLVKHLPPGFTDSQLYDLFRPYGALASVHAHTQFGPETGMVEFWSEDDARNAEHETHMRDIEGYTIAVQIYVPRRAPSGADFNAAAPAFIPNNSSILGPYTPQYSPRSPPARQASFGNSRSPPISGGFMHGPGQQVQLAPTSGPGSNSHSGLIDPCNLFCKNLDADMDSNDLFNHFRQYGQIVSARVMRTDTGESRGFGFVSFQLPEQANAAMHAMNGRTIGTKQIVVRLHEPKQLRQEKLAHRFSGGNGHPRSASGATSPAGSEDNYSIFGSPRQRSINLTSPSRPDRGRRGSGSYYNAALTGTLNLPMRYEELSSLSPVVRKEVLTGEFIRRVKALEIVQPEEQESMVEALVGLSLAEAVAALESQDQFVTQVQTIQSKSSRSGSGSRDSRVLDPSSLAATASAPDHPSTPVSASLSLSTPPRTTSPSGSMPPGSERDRMLAAISKLESSNQVELTELMMSLPKRDRALCLFNNEVLRAKLADAKMVLESDDADEVLQPVLPSTPQSKKPSPLSKVDASPRTPELSASRGPSAVSSPMPATPSHNTKEPVSGAQYTLESLSKLPAQEIMKIAISGTTPDLPIGKADPLKIQETNEWVDSLHSFNEPKRKQQVGDKLAKILKAAGIRSSGRVTLTLLDKEDLRGLAHLMQCYPEVLKQKALSV